MHNERLKRLRKMAKKHGLILRRPPPRNDGLKAGYELVYRERELWGSADTLKELEARFIKEQHQI